MITLSTSALDPRGAIRLTQKATTPLVYFDHWALIKLALNPRDTARFAGDIKALDGTLGLSFVGLLEFAKGRNPNTVPAVETLLEEVGSAHLCFLEADPDVVRRREDEILAGRSATGPHLDGEFPKTLISISKNLNPLCLKGVISMLRNRPETLKRWEELTEAMNASVYRVRSAMGPDPAVRRRVKEVRVGPRIPHPTRYLASELIKAVIREGGTLTGNDWFDFFHAVVPVSYCDIVLLDGPWRERVEKACARLKKAKLLTQQRRVFSEKDLDEFWEYLETTTWSGDYSNPTGGGRN